ncbi:hypothetical protein PLICRDRAFT_692936 [Plicaturopsis crispa FD-325 SS-3]|nr:hypothetical protein PLICRDRAFT_692936 [Plicaturopsis crispa FD-325 SS-3]
MDSPYPLRLLSAQAENDASKSLSISVLVWDSAPYMFHAECQADGDEIYGTYERPQPPTPLRLKGWSQEHSALLYVPASDTPFPTTYTRTSHTGPWPDEATSDVVGLTEEHNPRFFLHLHGEEEFPQEFPDEPELSAEAEERPSRGPPFSFRVTDEKNGYGPYELLSNGAELPMPDLLADTYARSIDRATAFEEGGRGWGGQYVRDLLERSKQMQPLGSLTKVVRYKDDQWAVELELEPKDLVETDRDDIFPSPSDSDDDSPPGPFLKAYTIKITILRVYVKPTFLSNRDQSQPESSTSVGPDASNANGKRTRGGSDSDNDSEEVKSPRKKSRAD